MQKPVKYLQGNFKTLLASWKKRWKEYKIYRMVKKEEKALNKAKKLAILKASMNGYRYWVLRDANGDFVPLNKLEIQELQREGIMSRKVNAYHLMREAEFFTSTKAKVPKTK